jgi:hypothetical protein
MLRFRRDCAFVAVLCMVVGCCATTGAALAALGTGGSPIPEQIAPTTGGFGYGTPGLRSIVVVPLALAGEVLKVRGTMPGAARRRIILQRLDPRRGWRTIARARVRTSERFAVRWRPDLSGRVDLRAVVLRRRGAEAASSVPVATVVVYRPARATYFGPGLFGRQTACGPMLTPDLHGVAHRSLPCGTRVAIMYGRREITVPVVDRGPFAAGYSWDLTQATADALGFTGAGAIGYVREASRRPTTSAGSPRAQARGT